MVCEPCEALPRNLIVQLIELYEDVERWRENGGDARDLRYVLETSDRIDPQAVEWLKACCKELL